MSNTCIRLRNMQNFQEQLQTQLYQKRKAFSGFFIAFLQCTSSLEHLETKEEPSSVSVLEIIDSKGSGYLNV